MYVLSSHRNVELRPIKIKDDMDALNQLFNETMGSDPQNADFYKPHTREGLSRLGKTTHRSEIP